MKHRLAKVSPDLSMHMFCLKYLSLPKADGMPSFSSQANKKWDELDTY